MISQEKDLSINLINKPTSVLTPIVIILVIILTRYYGNYFIFHSFAELFSIFVSLSISFVTYYTFKLTKNRYLLFLGLGYFWVAILDIIHTQTYPGISIYEINGANTTLTIWIFTRILESITILLALFMSKKEFDSRKVMTWFGLFSLFVIILALYSPLSLYSNEEGLSSLKITVEYLVIFILLATLKLNSIHKNDFNKNIFNTIQLAIVFTIISEAFFTLYIDMHGVFNVIGHIFKFLSFWVLLVSVIKVSLEEPLLFITKKENQYNNINWLRKLLDNSHIGILVVDKNRKNIFVNEQLCEMYGYKENELLEYSAEILHVNHERYLKFAELAFDFVLKGKSVDIDYQFKRKDGTLFWAHISGDVIDNANEVLWTIVDITKRKKVETDLKQQHKYLQSIIDGIDDPIMVIQEDYTAKLMNSTLKESIRDLKIADPLNPKCYELSHNRSTPCDGLEHPCPLRDVLDTKRHTTVVHKHDTKDGKNRNIELSASPLFDTEKNCIGIIESARDITNHLEVQDELRAQKSILDHQAHHDSLTGLPNRILFHDRLTQAIEKSKRKNSKIALLFIDLDHFKEINDSLGHDIGDEILKEVSYRLGKATRDEDTVARLGGDEFTVVLEDLHHPEDASSISNKILESLSKPINVNDNVLYVSSSIGISIYPDDGQSPQSLLKFADSAMYKAKDEGRNNYQYYNSTMTELAFERVVMETSLRVALKNEEFVVYYQPQVNGAKDTIIGMEALVRWQHPTMGLVAPDKFIPLAESTGLIVELDRYVMKTAMTQLSQWYKDGLNPGVLAMNLAVKQLKQEDFISMFEDLIKETNCKTQWLELEVTESQIMTNPEEAIITLQKISDLGIELAVDDFGTGYSSLAYLKRLPIDKLKIDKAFINNLPDDEEDSAIAKAVIALAKSLNLKVIAEGVESKEQRDFITLNGCENIQGYFYSKPVPAEEMSMIIKNGF